MLKPLGYVLCLLVVISTVPLVATAHSEHSTNEAVELRMEENGTADVTLRFTYNLSNTAEQKAFNELNQNESFKQEIRDETTGLLRDAVSSYSNELDRTTSIKDSRIELTTVGSTGVVEVSATWTNLASVENSTIRLTQPFASGFNADRDVILYIPDGYGAVSVTPDETVKQTTSEGEFDNRLVWDQDESFEGFEVQLAEEDNQDNGTGSLIPDISPLLVGFGAALLTVVLVTLYSRRV